MVRVGGGVNGAKKTSLSDTTGLVTYELTETMAACTGAYWIGTHY